MRPAGRQISDRCQRLGVLLAEPRGFGHGLRRLVFLPLLLRGLHQIPKAYAVDIPLCRLYSVNRRTGRGGVTGVCVVNISLSGFFAGLPMDCSASIACATSHTLASSDGARPRRMAADPVLAGGLRFHEARIGIAQDCIGF